jgi:hypothetical protein
VTPNGFADYTHIGETCRIHLLGASNPRTTICIPSILITTTHTLIWVSDFKFFLVVFFNTAKKKKKNTSLNGLFMGQAKSDSFLLENEYPRFSVRQLTAVIGGSSERISTKLQSAGTVRKKRSLLQTWCHRFQAQSLPE